ncbi:MAG: glyoxal reductase [Candidatus Saccharibacteria bacterium]|nr:glyoxal reductase [Candidatus Saccharibacteria bacterium]
MTDIPHVKLNNDVTMPQFGLGVWQAEEGGEVERAVMTALEAGYRLIDTAAIYGNEAGVGKAIRDSGIPREEIFVTSKLWNDSHDYDTALAAYDASLERLGLDYLDLYLIHWPVPADNKYPEAWRALEKLYADKRVRAIGVSNFKPHHLEKLLQTAEVIPTVNQIELHPKLQQRETRDFCAQHEIKVESYSPLMRAGEVLQDPVITEIAEAHHKTPAQIVLRWHIQNGLIVIPKSTNPSRIRENVDIFDFHLTDAEMERINSMDEDKRIGSDPDTANFK